MSLTDGRVAWLLHLASRVITAEPARSFGGRLPTPLGPVERALVEVHVGLTHLMGGDAAEAALGEFCRSVETEDVVSRWRNGIQELHVVGELRNVWSALLRVGSWAGLVRYEIVELVEQSFLATHLPPTAPNTDLLGSLWKGIGHVDQPSFEFDEIWNCNDSHLERIRFADEITDELVAALCLLEWQALVGARRQERLEESFQSCASVIRLHQSIKGSWGGPNANDVPPWFRDYAVANGGRQLQDRAGVIPCWFLVAESVEELRAISSWRNASSAIAIATRKGVPVDEVLLQIEIDFDDGGKPGFIQFSYATSSTRSATSLDMVAWVGFIRLEVYEVHGGQLRYAFAHGVHLSNARDALSDPAIRLFPEYNWLVGMQPTSGDVLFRMQNVERVQFELVRRGEAARRASLEPVLTVYENFLSEVDRAASSSFAGVTLDSSPVDRSQRALLTALSLLENPVAGLALDQLGADRGFAQVQYIQDEPARVICSVAWDPGSGVEARQFTLAIQDYENGGLAPDHDEIEELKALGTAHLVLSPAGPLYARPIHEDFLDDGFGQVTYVHRSAILSPDPPSAPNGREILIAGWAGDEGSPGYLSFLDRELSAIELIHGRSRGDLESLESLPVVVHLAGHGSAGDSPIDHWLKVSKTTLLTPSRVLLEADASATDLIYLSACSTGRGVFGIRSVMQAVPLDVAFLERGATCVLSTSAPVNDVIATVFAIAFHAAWGAGSTIWDAYVEARSASSRGMGSPEVMSALNEVWETWSDDRRRAGGTHPEDWMLFRLSGRAW